MVGIPVAHHEKPALLAGKIFFLFLKFLGHRFIHRYDIIPQPSNLATQKSSRYRLPQARITKICYKEEKVSAPTMPDFRRILSRYFLPVIIALAFFSFGLVHLTQFMTADEHYWLYERIPQYWHAIQNGDWKKTHINDKPGISLAFVSGIGLLSEPHPETLCSRAEDLSVRCDTTRTRHILLAFRLPILITNTLLLLYIFWIIQKISTRKTALWSIFFMALSPILVGISQIVNPDALLWSFGTAALFSYFAALRHPDKKYIFLSGIFLGLSLLSKYTAAILIPFFLMASVFSVIENPPTNTDKTSALRKNLLVFLHSFLIAIIIVTIFLPSVLMKPSVLGYILSGGSAKPFILISLIAFVILYADNIIFKGRLFSLLDSGTQKLRSFPFARYMLPWSVFLPILILVFGRILFPDWNIFERIPFDLKELTGDPRIFGQAPTLVESLLLELNPIVFSLTPIALFLTVAMLFLTPRSEEKDTPQRFEIAILLTCIIAFVSMLIVFDVLATPRYLILLYPIFAFLAAVGFIKIEKIVTRNTDRSSPAKILLAFIVILSSFASILLSRPFYFDYSNSLLPKTALISDAWGYGGYEAAQHLNSLPDAKHLVVWTDYEGVCEFFRGTCMVKQYKYANDIRIDYAIVTRRGRILYNPDHSRWAKEGNFYMKPAYDNKNPEWQLTIDDRPGNFIKVVKVEGSARSP